MFGSLNGSQLKAESNDDGESRLRYRFEDVRLKIRAFQMPRNEMGDFWENSNESRQKSIECLEGLVESVNTLMESKIASHQRINMLAMELKSLQSRFEGYKHSAEKELQEASHKASVLAGEKQERKKEILALQAQVSLEKSSAETKVKQLHNELRRKEQQLKNMNEKLFHEAKKQGTKILNDFAISGSTRAFAHSAPCRQDELRETLQENTRQEKERLLEENAGLRQMLVDCHQRLVDALERRCASIGKPETAEAAKPKSALDKLREVVASLDGNHFRRVAAEAVSGTLDELLRVFDRIDAIRLGSGWKHAQFEESDGEVDQVNDLQQLKAAVKRYRSVANAQNNLIKFGIYRNKDLLAQVPTVTSLSATKLLASDADYEACMEKLETYKKDLYGIAAHMDNAIRQAHAPPLASDRGMDFEDTQTNSRFNSFQKSSFA